MIEIKHKDTGALLRSVEADTLSGANLTSDTGNVSFDNENLTTTGYIQTGNITSGAYRQWVAKQYQ